MSSKLRCHVVGCDCECVNAADGPVSDPYTVEYFCNAHHAEFGRSESELYCWKTGLSEDQVMRMIESLPYGSNGHSLMLIGE